MYTIHLNKPVALDQSFLFHTLDQCPAFIVCSGRNLFFLDHQPAYRIKVTVHRTFFLSVSSFSHV